jgi:hypothetical protein
LSREYRFDEREPRLEDIRVAHCSHDVMPEKKVEDRNGCFGKEAQL